MHHRVDAQLVAALDENRAMCDDCKAACEYIARRAPQGKQRDRSVRQIPRFGSSLQFSSFDDTYENAKTAILERVFYHLPSGGRLFTRPYVPTEVVVNSTLRRFAKRLNYIARTLTPVPLLEYPSSVYSGQKLAMYQRAANVVHVRGVRKSDSYLSTFLKHEKIAETTKRAVPRVISPRSPVYNVEVGRYLHQLEQVIYKDIAKLYGRPTVMKGYNASQVGQLISQTWGTFRDPRAVGLDASRFDQHVSCPMLKWEHSCYAMYYPNDENLKRLLQWQLLNRGTLRTWDGTVQYRVNGGRCSGDMNTAMGNCLIMCAMVHTLLESINLAGKYKSKVALFNNGDDCLLIGEASDIELLVGVVPAYFSRLGFEMKVEAVVDSLELCSFCQCQPVYDGVQYVMCRDPRVSMSKDVTILDPLNASIHLSNQLFAIGECGLALASGLPIMQSYYSALRRGQRPGRGSLIKFQDSGFYRLSVGMSKRVRDVNYMARVSFYRAFGVLPDVQLAAERYYDSLPVIVSRGETLENLGSAPKWWALGS